MKPLRRADGTLETGLIRHHMDPWDTGDPRIDRYDDQDTATSDMLALLDEVDAMRNRIADLERDLEKNKAASGRARFRARVLGRAVSEAHQALDRRRVWSCQARLEAAGIVHTILVDVLDEAAQALGGARPSEEPAPDTGVVGTWRKRSIDVQAAQLTGDSRCCRSVSRPFPRPGWPPRPSGGCCWRSLRCWWRSGHGACGRVSSATCS